MARSPLQGAADVVSLTIVCDGRALDDANRVVSVEVTRAINRIPSASLVLLDGDMPDKEFPLSDADTFKPGAEVEIKAGYAEDETTLFKGIVVRHGIKISRDNFARLVVECRDAAVKMTVGRRNANYVDMTDSDIIAAVIKGHAGLTSDVEATSAKHPEVVQHYATDWDFLVCRAELNGLLVSVQDGKVAVSPPQASATPELIATYGEDLIDFDADLDARSQLASVTAVGWDPRQQAVAERSARPAALNKQGNLGSAELAKVLGLDDFRLQSAAVDDSALLEAWAAGEQVKAGLARVRGRMTFQGDASAKPNALIEVAGVGERFNGPVFVAGVRHAIADGQWTTEVEFGMSPRRFAETGDIVAPPASGLVPGVEGLQIGVVQQLDKDPQEQTRVQVAVPLLQAETKGVWARLVSFYASDSIGACFVPEIGDEVVLGYLDNDPARPVILGSLYSAKRKPPREFAAENPIKALVTRSELTIEFDDDKKILKLSTPGGNSVTLSDDEESIVLEDLNGNKVELAPGGIVLDSPKDIAIKAQGKISVEAMGEIGVESQADVSVKGLNVSQEANIGFTAKGNASAELSASGQTTVKGAMVMIN